MIVAPSCPLKYFATITGHELTITMFLIILKTALIDTVLTLRVLFSLATLMPIHPITLVKVTAFISVSSVTLPLIRLEPTRIIS